MLAGKMKLKTFLALLGLGGAAVVGFGGLLISQMESPPPEPPANRLITEDVTRPALTTPPPTATTETTSAPSQPAVGAGTGRAVDPVLLAYSGKDIGSKKLKDVTKGKAFKVNVYQDEGNSTVNRAKVDLDRDDKWDEKWTFADDGITRKVAPDDDEDYSQVFRWTGTEWASE